MANTLISLRISRELLKESETIARAEGYSNTQEFIREAIRRQVEERRQRIIDDVSRLYGMAKGKQVKEPGREERDDLARKAISYPELKQKLDRIVASAKRSR